MVNPSARKYLQQVRGWIPCGRKMKHRTMAQIEDNLDHFLDENPNVDYQAIVDRFGTPEKIAATYVDEMDTPELLSNLRIKRKIVQIVVSAAAVAVAIWLGVAAVAFAISIESVDGEINTSIDVYEEYIFSEEG